MKERNCENCIHHTADGCSSWDCEFEAKDLISRADAIEAVAQEWLSEASAESPYVNDDDIGEYRKLAEKLFDDLPSAEAVQVVRCKDCRHRDLFSCPLAENDFQKDDDFCSWGERKEP